MKRGHITFFISSYFSTIKAQRSLLFSAVTLPIFNFDLIVLRTSISSICNEILNLNFTKSRSKVIKKLPSASVKPENQNKKSSETSDNLEFSVSEISDSLLETVEKYQNPVLFLLPDTLIKNKQLIPVNGYKLLTTLPVISQSQMDYLIISSSRSHSPSFINN